MKSQCCFSTGHEVFPWLRGIYTHTHTSVSSQDAHTGGKIDRGSTEGVAMGSNMHRYAFFRKVNLNNYCCHIC